LNTTIPSPPAPANIWTNKQFQSYLSSTAFFGVSFSMQQLLVAWLLVGVLALPADQVGVSQALIGAPGIFLILWGGAAADRMDMRQVLVVAFAIAPVFPIALLLFNQADLLNVYTVTLWGIGMGVVTSYANPAQQAILNRVTGHDLQKGVTASTAIGFLVQMAGLMVAGQMERFGLPFVLVVQAICLAISAVLIRSIAAQAPNPNAAQTSALRNIADGFRATFQHRVVFDVLAITFVSSIFNAGAFFMVLPFIIKRIYDGDATLLATMLIVFYGGAMIANLVMLRYMPFAHPGRLFLVLQLSRVVILFLLWIEPSWALLVTAIILWGLNMGVTSTLARTIVQESAEAEFRGRVLSVFSLGMMGSMPIGALVLGVLIEAFGTLNALLPAIGTSVLVFIYGAGFTEIWRYRSPSPQDVVKVT
jgi:predicted MFS family arabinose efflux permease